MSGVVSPRRHEPALDGIRGCAVAGVLIFHGGYLKGGYLGVDAFFVLSGFLITSLLLHEAGTRGRISLTHFWARRARRLLPALGCVLIVVAFYAAFIAKTNELNAIRWDAITTLIYGANWRQVFARVDYFALYNGPGTTAIVNSPLNHTWSLAIEEQFYVFWPIIVYLIAKGRTTAQQCRNVFNTALILAITSMVLAQILYQRDSTTRVYFGTDTRIAAILFGAMLAAWTSQHGHVRTKTARTTLELASLVSLIGLAFAWTRLDGASPALFRGGLIACGLGVTIIIAAGVHPQRSITYKILTIAPLRALGAISYGLYLWHVVIYVVVNETRTGIHGPALLALRLTITLAVSWASYQFIERPIRYGRGTQQLWQRVTPIGAIMIIVALFASTIGATSPYASAQTYTKKGGVLIVGDSTAHSIYPGLARANLKINESWAPGCRLLAGEITVKVDFNKPCEWRTTWKEALERLEPSVVVLVMGGWELFDIRDEATRKVVTPGSQQWNDAYEQVFDEALTLLASTGAKVVAPNKPCFGAQSGALTFNGRSATDVQRVEAANSAARAVLKRHPIVTSPDMFSYLCPNGKFQQDLGNVKDVRPDGVHFGTAGSKLIADWLLPQIQAAVPYLNLLRTGPLNYTSVLAYGGLNLFESQAALKRQFETLPFFKLSLNAQPFMALCDINKTLRADIQQRQPAFIIITDVGASGTACTRDATGTPVDRLSAAYYKQFRMDAQRLFAIAQDVPVIFVLPPALKSAKDRNHIDKIFGIIRDERAERDDVVISTVVHDAFGGDKWSQRQPCLDGEKTLAVCVDGTAQVHGPRGNELCPHGYGSVPGIIRGCLVYSSGAVRYSNAIAYTIGGATRDIAKSDAIATGAKP